MTEDELDIAIRKARERVTQMDATDGHKDRLPGTMYQALRCGLLYPQTGAHFDALVMLEDLWHGWSNPIAKIEKIPIAEVARFLWRQDAKEAKELHRRGYGLCKGSGCKYERKYVPLKKWVKGDGRWECPECGWGIAPELRHAAEHL